MLLAIRFGGDATIVGRSGRTANFFGVAGFPDDSFSMAFDTKGLGSVRNSASLALASGFISKLDCLGPIFAFTTSGALFSAGRLFDFTLGVT